MSDINDTVVEPFEATPETAAQCFERLMREGKSPKFKTALERVRKACDTIQQMGGILNVNRISEYCVNHFGGPSPSGLNNNKNHTLYIKLRRREAQDKNAPAKKSRAPAAKYPVEGLDERTKSFIDRLLDRNKLLEGVNQWQRQALEHKTRAKPLKLGQAITAGPDKNMALNVLESPEAPGQHPPAVSSKLLEAIQSVTTALETLETQVDNLTFDVRPNGKKRLLWESPANTDVLISASQWQALMDAQEESDG